MSRSTEPEERSWEPCLADRHLGVAFFDGIRIDTDRITDPRWDRVLPILEEEQIYMCRAMKMRGLLRPGLRVLDVGTGSGVFAIWAAAHGCDVVAIDCSARALRFTEHNLGHPSNEAMIARSGGKVTPLQREISNFANAGAEGLGPFDLVFLAPPYNPTCEGVSPALHAEAGPVGQRAFEEQLPLAWGLAKPGGTIIGNQMAYHNRGDVSGWWHTALLRSVPNDELPFCTTAYAPILSEAECSAASFLEGQYRNYLTASLRLRPAPHDVKAYIARQLRRYQDPVFALYYYEIHRGTVSPPTRSSLLERIGVPLQPPASWKSRIDLHQRIVEHTAARINIPAPALFLANDFAPSLPSKRITDRILPLSERFDQSQLSSLLRWVVQLGMINGDEPAFDLLLIDVGPWFDTWEGRRDLYQEALLCVCKEAIASDGNGVRDRLRQYQLNTKSQQEEGLGPFLHPRFTGADSSSDWRDVQYHVVSPELDDGIPHFNLPFARQDQDDLDNILRVLHMRFESLRATSQPELSDIYEIVDTAPGVEAVYTGVSLADLGVRNDQNSAERPLVSRDPCRQLELLHVAYHNRVRSVVGCPGGASQKFTSAMIGVPLAIAVKEDPGLGAVLPRTFRGGLWIYAATRRRLGPREESLLFDLARLSSILVEASVTALASSSLVDNLRRNYEGTFAHEVRDMIDGISASTPKEQLQNIRRYFSMLAIQAPDFDREKQAPLTLWDRYRRSCPLGFALGATFGALFNNHWRIAKVLENTKWQVKRERWDAVKVLPRLEGTIPTYAVNPRFDPASNPNITATELKQRVLFSLALNAAIRNLFKHADDSAPVEVSLDEKSLVLRNRRTSLNETEPRGTVGILRSLAAHYSPENVHLVQSKVSSGDPWLWETRIPFPDHFLLWRGTQNEHLHD